MQYRVRSLLTDNSKSGCLPSLVYKTHLYIFTLELEALHPRNSSFHVLGTWEAKKPFPFEKKMSAANPSSSLSNLNQEVELDYQYDDKAWYSVHLQLEEEEEKKLVMKYKDFSDEYNQVFFASDFKNGKQLDEFVMKFRLTSVQLQDHDCKRVVEGMTVSACLQIGDEEVKYFDAVVGEVNSKDHEFQGGEEVCTCIFLLYWLYGPNSGIRTPIKIESICLIQSGNVETNPTLALYLEACRDRLKADLSNYNVLSDPIREGFNEQMLIKRQCKARPSWKSRAPSTKGNKKQKSSKKSAGKAPKFTGKTTEHRENTQQDKDLGGKFNLTEHIEEVPSFHFMLIENLETDLFPSVVVDFIKNHLSINSQALLFPSLSWEPYTKGVIVVNSQKDLQKLAEFLDNPVHIVSSSRGRPWVITEKKLRRGAVETIGSEYKNLTTLFEVDYGLQIWPCDKSHEIGEKIKLLLSGTEEYMKSKQWRDLYLKYADDQRGICQKFVLEESKFWHNPS